MRNRFRRLRGTQTVRDMVAETVVTKKDLVYPMFVIEGDGIKEPIPSMPGVFRYSVDNLDEIMDQVKASGISGVLLFGVPAHKDAVGSEAYNPDGIVQQAIRYIKEKYPEIIVIADICLCEYTDHGHCGVLHGHEILNDETLPLLARMALTCVQAGADMVAPSDMMDGDVEAIRELLDENGYVNTPIMGYSAKYASGYYSPFRDAAGSAPSFGDRKSYQMDIRNGKEGIRELENDVDMGADILMVKPGLTYLDVLKEASLTFDFPMVKAAAQNGWIDEKRIVMENMISFKRAGASVIITYHALDVAGWLDE